MNTMRTFVRENLILISGILLPILLVICFYLAALLPKLLVQPPQYDLLYLTSPYPHDGVNTEVVNGKLKIWVTPQVRKGELPMPRLFLFEAKTQSSREIPIPVSSLPTNTRPNTKEAVVIPEIQSLTLDTRETAPDGYQAKIDAPNYGNLVSILVFSNYQRNFVISKRGNTINISDENSAISNYKSIKFLGWVIPK